MKNDLKIFCLSMNPNHLNLIKSLNYIPVGLGVEKFTNEWMQDKTLKNISYKNKFYGEYTFHFWIWKNYLDKINSNWIGFCQYRKFFLNEKIINNDISIDQIRKFSFKSVNENLSEYDCILGEKFSVENYKFTKVFKNYLLDFIINPQRIFFKKYRTIKLHFDLYHGKGNLDKAIDLLDHENRDNFRHFVNSKTSFNPHNMFICKKKYLVKYYESIFPWLERCEKIFGFDNLNGYAMQRIYGFLAERYLSYWFSKNCRVKELPIIVKDLSDYKNF